MTKNQRATIRYISNYLMDTLSHPAGWQEFNPHSLLAAGKPYWPYRRPFERIMITNPALGVIKKG